MLTPHEMVVVGDRLFTGVVLAHRLTHPRTPWNRLIPLLARTSYRFGSAPLAVWMTGVWQREYGNALCKVKARSPRRAVSRRRASAQGCARGPIRQEPVGA